MVSNELLTSVFFLLDYSAMQMFTLRTVYMTCPSILPFLFLQKKLEKGADKAPIGSAHILPRWV